jgi:hypothetical protein
VVLYNNCIRVETQEVNRKGLANSLYSLWWCIQDTLCFAYTVFVGWLVD